MKIPLKKTQAGACELLISTPSDTRCVGWNMASLSVSARTASADSNSTKTSRSALESPILDRGRRRGDDGFALLQKPKRPAVRRRPAMESESGSATRGSARSPSQPSDSPSAGYRHRRRCRSAECRRPSWTVPTSLARSPAPLRSKSSRVTAPNRCRDGAVLAIRRPWRRSARRGRRRT